MLCYNGEIQGIDPFFEYRAEICLCDFMKLTGLYLVWEFNGFYSEITKTDSRSVREFNGFYFRSSRYGTASKRIFRESSEPVFAWCSNL